MLLVVSKYTALVLVESWVVYEIPTSLLGSNTDDTHFLYKFLPSMSIDIGVISCPLKLSIEIEINESILNSREL